MEKRNVENLTGISNSTYDLMSVLTNKLEGIAAIEQYKQDVQADQEVMRCFEQIQEQDCKDVDQLRSLLSGRMQM